MDLFPFCFQWTKVRLNVCSLLRLFSFFWLLLLQLLRRRRGQSEMNAIGARAYQYRSLWIISCTRMLRLANWTVKMCFFPSLVSRTWNRVVRFATQRKTGDKIKLLCNYRTGFGNSPKQKLTTTWNVQFSSTCSELYLFDELEHTCRHIISRIPNLK